VKSRDRPITLLYKHGVSVYLGFGVSLSSSLLSLMSVQQSSSLADGVGVSYLEGTLKSLGMICVSELGDKTFFIAAVLAMRHSRRVVFGACWGALALMTILSAFMGFLAPSLLSRKYTHILSCGLFLFFGLRSLYEVASSSSSLKGKAQGELREVEEELSAGETSPASAHENGVENGGTSSSPEKRKLEGDRTGVGYAGRTTLLRIFSPFFLQAFTMTFLAEWGDKSQISTVAMAAQDGLLGVALGGVLGHAVCTGMAVVGGREMGTVVSERTVEFVAGVLFVLFGLHAWFEGA